MDGTRTDRSRIVATLGIEASPDLLNDTAQRAPAATPLRERMRAAGIHLLLCIAIAAAVLALVYLAWYPAPMPALLGVGSILLIMLGCDVVIGPLFTLIVFDRRKKSLRWDLGIIAAVQCAALVYGLVTVYQGRPAFVVFVKDRYELVSPSDLRAEDIAAAGDRDAARVDPLRPRWVTARMPDSAEERSAILMEAMSGGRDVQHFPRLYVEHTGLDHEALAKAQPLDRLRTLNPARLAELDAQVARTGRAAGELVFVPIHGPSADGAALIGRSDGKLLAVTSLVPW